MNRDNESPQVISVYLLRSLEHKVLNLGIPLTVLPLSGDISRSVDKGTCRCS